MAKKSYYFLIGGRVTGRGYVDAESREEAERLIRDGEFDDIFDDDIEYDYDDFEITGEESEEEDGDDEE